MISTRALAVGVNSPVCNVTSYGFHADVRPAAMFVAYSVRPSSLRIDTVSRPAKPDAAFA